MRRAEHAGDLVLISTADWDNPYWTNKQHTTIELARAGYRVLYIESQGLRAPTATAKDMRRIWSKLKNGLRPPRRVRENVLVWAPLVIPLHRYRVVQSLNRWALAAGLRFWCIVFGLKPFILWTYSPMTTRLYLLSGYEAVVYHAVDDVKAQPGMPRETIAAAEHELSTRADVIFTTAPHLQEIHAKLNPNTHYFPNVADFAHFNTALDETTIIPDDLSRIPGPRIGFVGAISSYKLDFELIRDLAAKKPVWSFVFIGEVGEGDPRTSVSMFDGMANVHFLGGRPYKLLPAYLKGMDAVMQPSLLNEYTRSMFPMKFFEYLAAGKCIVSTKLPALADYTQIADFCTTSDEFAMALSRILAGDMPPLEARLATAREHTYETRSAKMRAIVGKTLLAKAG